MHSHMYILQLFNGCIPCKNGLAACLFYTEVSKWDFGADSDGRVFVNITGSYLRQYISAPPLSHTAIVQAVYDTSTK